MSEIRNIQNERASQALKALGNGSANSIQVPEDLEKLLVSLPTMILTDGIGQTLAFLLSKSEKEKKAFHMLKDRIIDVYSTVLKCSKNASDYEFLMKFQSSDIEPLKYVEMQRECLRYVEWLKLYGRSFKTNSNSKE